MQVEVDILIKRFEKAKSIKGQWHTLMQECYEYALPNRNLFNTQTQGAKKVNKVFDSTAISSTISFANRIQSSLLPPFTKWMKLKAGPGMPKANHEQANALLDDVTEGFFAVIASSNFDVSANEVLLDLAVGTGGMLVLEGPDETHPVVYTPVPIAQLMLEEGPWGAVGAIYREHKVHARNLKGQWPEIKIPAEIEQAMKDSPDLEVDLIEATYLSKDIWYYDVIWQKQKERLLSRKYDVNPWITPRWIKVAGEVYGRGPLVSALPDIKTLNKLVELVLKNASLHISGVYTGVDDGVLNPNNVVIRPGVVIPVASNGGTRGPSLQSLERTGSFDLASLEHEKLTMHIKEMLLDNRLPPESGAVRSPTEIIERVKELSQDVGSPFGRLYRELIVPVVQRTLSIMVRRGLIKPIKVDGMAIQVQVISPMAQQQNLDDVQTVVQWMTILGSFGPEVAALTARVEEVGTWIGDKLGVPAELMRTAEEKSALQKMAAKVQQQQQAPDASTQSLAGQAAGLDIAA